MRFSDINRKPSSPTLRQFAGLWIIFFGGMAAWKAATAPLAVSTYALGAMALVIGVIGLVRPNTVRLLYVGWMILAFPIGWLVSHVLLAVLYLFVFLPVGLVFWLIGRDPLALKKPAGNTYWTEKPAVEDVLRYFRQY